MNNFKQQLKDSNKPEVFIQCYKAFFGEQFVEMVDCSKDMDKQYKGVDRIIKLKNGKEVLVDEKIREKDYPDILLEYVSNEEGKTKGWVEKDLAIDYVAYAILPRGSCFMLDFNILKKTWLKNKEAWISKYGITRARTDKIYTTLNCAIPVVVLLKEMAQCSIVGFEAVKSKDKKTAEVVEEDFFN